jgi:hypothetical protein
LTICGELLAFVEVRVMVADYVPAVRLAVLYATVRLLVPPELVPVVGPTDSHDAFVAIV